MVLFTRVALVLGFLGWVGSTHGLAVTPTPTQTRFSNSTTRTSSGSFRATTSACCFVVLDTIYENWWQEVSTSTYTYLVNLTSITTLVTPYPNVTSTNYETNVYATNATFYLDVDIGFNPITLYTNDAPRPKETGTILDAIGTTGGVNQALTAVTTAGTVIHSPQAFWAYSTVRIVTAEAVTDKSGNKACGTTSAFQSLFPFGTTTATYSNAPVFTDINSNVNSYFFTNQTATQTGVVIRLTTPFVYAPTRGATLVSGKPQACAQGPGTENYGYPVQTLLDYLVRNPVYSSQYHGLENCLPGGPEIVQLTECSEVAPQFEVPGGDLTSSTVITVTPTGATAQPQSVVSPTTASPTKTATETVVPLLQSPSSSEIPPVVSAPPSETTSPSPSANQAPSPSTESPASEQTSTPTENSPSPSTGSPAGDQNLTPTEPSPSPSTESPAEQQTSTPTENSPSTPPNNLSSPEASNTVAPTTPNAPDASSPPSSPNTLGSLSSPNPTTISPASSSAAAIASAIASLIGVSPITASPTLISGTSDLVISGATMIPINPAIPLSGSTTIINGVTSVIISSATTIPVSQLVANLPGSTTEIGGTLNVVLGTGASPTTLPLNSNIPGLSGSTFISVSGSQTETFVVVSKPETVPVVLGQPTQSTLSGAASGGVLGTGSGGGVANSTAPLKFSSSASRTWNQNLMISLLCAILTLSIMVAF